MNPKTPAGPALALAALTLAGCAATPEGGEAGATRQYALVTCLGSIYRMLPPRYDYVAELLEQEGKGFKERGRLSDSLTRRIDAEARAFASSTPPSMAVRACTEWSRRITSED